MGDGGGGVIGEDSLLPLVGADDGGEGDEDGDDGGLHLQRGRRRENMIVRERMREYKRETARKKV